MKSKFILLSLLALLAAGQTAMAETVTYTISGTTEQNGSVNFTVTASSGDASGSASTTWASATATSASVSLPGSINLSFGTNKTSNGMAVKGFLQIEATSSSGGYITLSHASKYIYHVTLKDKDGGIIHEAWNMTKSYTYHFQTILLQTIVVEYATAIPFTDAVISGVDNSYVVSDTDVKPVPTVTWHGTTLTRDTHYTLSWNHSSSAGTATVNATGKGIFSSTSAASKDYTLVWATYTVHFDKNSDIASGSMSDQAFTYSTAQALTANAFTAPTGYIFTGWNTAANGSGDSYTDGQSVSNLTATNGATITLYAQWTDLWGISSGANGTQANPYVITTPAGLNYLASRVNGTDGHAAYNFSGKFFKLDADIAYDPNSLDANGENYTAIGTYQKYFSGSFNGYGHTISGIRINKDKTNNSNDNRYQGLFGAVSGSGTIQNVILNNARITGQNQLGGITGYIPSYHNYTIYNCLVLNTAIITSEMSDDVGVIGGSVGSGSTLNSSYYYNCTLTKGSNNPRTTNIGANNSDCDGARSVHALSLPANVTASGESVEINNAAYFAAGTTVTLSYSSSVPNGYTLSYSYNDGTDHAITGNTFTMPASDVTITATLTYEWTGNGTADNPYQITSYAGLKEFATIVNGTNPNACAELKYDIVCINNTGDANYAKDWVSIGNVSQPYTGTFDGQGYTITGLSTPTNNSSDYVGLFGYMGSGSVVKDVILENAAITGNKHVGVIAGYNNNGTLTHNYYVSCRANSATSNIGTGSGDCNGARGAYTITLTDGVTASGESVEINSATYFAAGTTVTLSYGGTDGIIARDVNNNFIPVTVVGGGVYTFTMPASAVTVSIGVLISYIDENGAEQMCIDYAVLTGEESTIGVDNETKWYVVSSDISFDHQITLFGDVRLILADDKTMAVTAENESGIKMNAKSDLTIYGQSGDTGSLEVTSNSNSIEARNITVNGGTVTATGDDYGIFSRGGTITGGTVTATGNTCGIYSENNNNVIINGGTVAAIATGTDGNGIYSHSTVIINGGSVTATGANCGISSGNSNVRIYGGNVTATGTNSCGISAERGYIELGWTNTSDSITATSYFSGYPVRVKSGQKLWSGQKDSNGDIVYPGDSGTYLQNKEIEDIAGQTLRPYFGTSTAELTLVQGSKDGVTAWWGTFYPGGNYYVLGEGAAAYTMDASHHLYRLGTDGRFIRKNIPVVIIATEATPVSPATSPATATIELYNIGPQGITNSTAINHAPGGNILQGSNSDIQVTDGQVDSQTPCVLSVVNGVVGFYPVANNYNGVIPANKAYYLTTTTP